MDSSNINPIKKIGYLMQRDAEGNLINECCWEAIQSPWRELVEALRNECLEKLGDRIHSLYLRGSIPRGQAILNVSDLDSIAIVKEEISPDLAAQIISIEEQLEQQYRFCQKVEINLLTYQDLIQVGSHWQAILQTQGLCIYGEDMRSQFPRFKPSLVLVSHAFQLAEDLAETQMILRQLLPKHPGFEATVERKCVWINKRIVRTGFELVMQMEETFTRDLYPCYERFSYHFPNQERLMHKALELAIQPSSNRAGLLMFLSHFGSWLVAKVDATFQQG